MQTALTQSTPPSAGEALLDVSPIAWSLFIGFMALAIFVDLFVLNRKHEVPTVKKAATHTAIWVTLGLVVAAIVFAYYGTTAGLEYMTGYVIEYSLSVDNVFVWGVVLSFFAVPRQYQHRVLFWGIFGALVMRFVFIFAGVELIERFSWVIIVLGLFLIYTAYKLATSDDEDMDISKSRAYKLVTRVLPVAEGQHGAHFTVRQGGKLLFTSTAVCLVMVEITDLMFAVDSVPAILAVAKDPFIIFASNAMAILGLRSLYFLFDAVKDKFSKLNEGLAIILGGVGIKMLISSDMNVFGWFSLPGYHVPTWLSLGFIVIVLAGSIVASMIWPPEEDSDEHDDAVSSTNENQTQI